MSDLISRSALIEKLEEKMFDSKLMCPVIKLTDLIELIDKQPTAYDIDKVVAELEEYRANFDCRFCKYNKTEKTVCAKDCTDALIDGLLDILRKGGVE